MLARHNGGALMLLVMVLMTLDLLGESGKILAVPGNGDAEHIVVMVASGGALLFGVNAWCLDGRGATLHDRNSGMHALGEAGRRISLTRLQQLSAG